MEPIINSQVPEFKVQAFQNGSFKTVSSEDIKGKWAIFFFYPADFTFVCPTELVDMADKYGKFQEMGVEVYSVSTDSHFVHKAWHDASETIRKIKYPMLADPTGALSRALGVYIPRERSRLPKSTITVSAVMQTNCFVKLKLPSSLLLTRTKFVLQSGKKAKQP